MKHLETQSITSVVFLTKMHNLKHIRRKQSDKPKLGDGLQNKGPALFKNVRKFKERPRNVAD